MSVTIAITTQSSQNSPTGRQGSDSIKEGRAVYVNLNECRFSFSSSYALHPKTKGYGVESILLSMFWFSIGSDVEITNVAGF